MALLYKELMISPQGNQSAFLSCNCPCSVQHLLDMHWFLLPLMQHLSLATLELHEITSCHTSAYAVLSDPPGPPCSSSNIRVDKTFSSPL